MYGTSRGAGRVSTAGVCGGSICGVAGEVCPRRGVASAPSAVQISVHVSADTYPTEPCCRVEVRLLVCISASAAAHHERFPPGLIALSISACDRVRDGVTQQL